MVLLAVAATLIQQVEPPRGFEILEEKSSKQKIAVTVVSRDGTTAVANDLQNWFILRSDAPREEVKGWRYSDFEPVGVKSDGMIVANRYKKGLQVVLYRGGDNRILGSTSQGMHSYGFSAEGTAFIEMTPPTDGRGNVLSPETRGVKVSDGDIAEVIRHPDVRSVLDSTEFGLLGHWMFLTDKWTATQVHHTISAVPHALGYGYAAYIQGANVRPFEVPAWGRGCHVSSWTDDGRTTFGTFGQAKGPGVPTIWRGGTILQTFMVKGVPARLWLKAFAKDGKLAVGHRGDFMNADLAMVWREKEGLQTLADYLAEKKVEIPEGWTLIDAVGITPNGAMITGTAIHKDKRIRPFRIRMEAPKPSATTDGLH